ncbi:beta-lactamase class C binding protein-like protein [Ephemerocybe angulata]|uniref:Beta-lactamase class C binding protein-like protein n=1 Tax=Ephemerocybe angulata TaxID=980116 RepID=A0A8H6MH24_9AGAR|nr:beta-lactamase class C binding protein-like protein [Tulosesus angulatus]
MASGRNSIIAVCLFLIFVLVLSSSLASTPRTSSHSNNVSDTIKAIFSLLLPSGFFNSGTLSPESRYPPGTPGRWPPTACPFPLPNLLTHNPVERDGGSNVAIREALSSLNEYLAARTSATDIDSLAIAVVTPARTIFDRGYGVLKANDTGAKQHLVDKHSIYRIASITKMFTVFETLLLRERGVLDFDDPVEKYIPEFKPPSASRGWSEHLRDREHGKEEQFRRRESPRVSLRQLASHTGGLGRDFPRRDIGKWPITKDWPTISPERNTTFENVLGTIKDTPLLSVPYSYPIYSNVGFDLLGLANVAANLQSAKESGADLAEEPKTHRDLVKRDILDVFGLNSSFYRLPEDKYLKDHIAVPAKDFEWTNTVLGDLDDAAGGQYSSLSDLAKLMQVFLSPNPPNKEHSYLPALLREWLRPLHIWSEGLQAVGAPWEIEYLPSNIAYGRKPGPSPPPIPYPPPSTPRRVPIYSKSGNLPGYHSLFALNPEFGYGVVVLVTGTYSNTHEFVFQALTRLQPAFQKALEAQVQEQYVGQWEPAEDDDGAGNLAIVSLLDSQLFLTHLIVDGIDVLRVMQEANDEFQSDPVPPGVPRHPLGRPVALWSTGRLHEFRMVIGRPSLNNARFIGCFPYWVSIDPGLTARGASLDLVYWEDGELVYPSAGVRFKKSTGRW